MKDDKVITGKVTDKDIVIRIPKKFVFNDFNEQVDFYKIKGNRKTDFIEEFTQSLVEKIEYSELITDIYDDLCDTDLVREIE